MKLDLIVPLYNPSNGWEKKFAGKFTQLVERYFQGDNELINLVLVNDGSPRNVTEKEIGFLRALIPHLEYVSYTQNQGKGHALRKGVEKAVTDYCIYSDYDFPFGLEIVQSIYQELQNGTDIVTGRRIGGNYFNSLPFKRQIISRGLVIFNRYILGLPVYDTQAGIKGFDKYGRATFLETTINRFLFDMEFILISSRVEGMTIKELPVSITNETVLSNFGFSVVRQEMTNLMKILIKKRNGRRRKEDII